MSVFELFLSAFMTLLSKTVGTRFDDCLDKTGKNGRIFKKGTQSQTRKNREDHFIGFRVMLLLSQFYVPIRPG